LPRGCCLGARARVVLTTRGLKASVAARVVQHHAGSADAARRVKFVTCIT